MNIEAPKPTERAATLIRLVESKAPRSEINAQRATMTADDFGSILGSLDAHNYDQELIRRYVAGEPITKADAKLARRLARNSK